MCILWVCEHPMCVATARGRRPTKGTGAPPWSLGLWPPPRCVGAPPSFASWGTRTPHRCAAARGWAQGRRFCFRAGPAGSCGCQPGLGPPPLRHAILPSRGSQPGGGRLSMHAPGGGRAPIEHEEGHALVVVEDVTRQRQRPRRAHRLGLLCPGEAWGQGAGKRAEPRRRRGRCAVPCQGGP